MYFLELLAEFNEKNKQELRSIYKEAETILKIIVASIKTSQKKANDYELRQSKFKNPKSKNTNE